MRPIARPVVPGNIESSSAKGWAVKAGDEVRVTLRDGRRLRFEVDSVDAAGVVAVDHARYETSDILTLERKSFSGLKTAVLASAGFAAFVLISYAAALGALAGGI